MSKRKQLSIETIKRWLRDDDFYVRQVAMNACQGKDIPLEIIERGLQDNNWEIRQAAINWYISKGLEVPIIRTIEPSEIVYKKCIGNVIVCAKIPKDAQIRGKINGKCRSNKAIIIDIIGEFCGESVGISVWDEATTYFKGDEIEIENFDYSNKVCSTGFHFFNTIEEAKRY